MGVGTPEDLLEAVARGIDMFDCVMPTRNGRHGLAFTRHGAVNLRNARHAADPRPLDAESPCEAARTYSRAYLHHLTRANEMLGAMLLSEINLAYYQELMAGMRAAIARRAASRIFARRHARPGSAAIFPPGLNARDAPRRCPSQARIPPNERRYAPNLGGVAMAVSLKVNGAARSVPAEPDTPLLYVLRNDFELNGAKFGCGLAQCGACTVLIDGKAVRSCVTPIGATRRRRDHHARRARHAREAASAAAGVHRRAGGAVRLLHQRHDHEREGAARSKSEAERGRGARRRSRQSLPLRHPQPDRQRRPARRREMGRT